MMCRAAVSSPMCASWIMPTSLAPSPIPKVTSPVLLTRAVTSAFCFGDTLQHTTAEQACPTCRHATMRSSVVMGHLCSHDIHM